MDKSKKKNVKGISKTLFVSDVERIVPKTRGHILNGELLFLDRLILVTGSALKIILENNGKQSTVAKLIWM